MFIKTLKTYITLLVILCASINTSPISASQINKANTPLTVVATTSMIADAVRQLGGSRVNVTSLMGPGVDPHSYRQTRSDIVKIVNADLIFRHGLYLEAQMEEFFDNISKKKALIDLGKKISKKQLLNHDEYKNQFDPHIWMDPELWVEVVTEIEKALIAHDPDGAEIYKNNTKKHLSQIKKLSSYSKKVLATVKQEQRILLTAHDAFKYFGKAYGFRVLGIQGISTESEAGLSHIEKLVKIIVSKKIAAVFVETSVNDRNIKALIEGAAAKGHSVRVGGELYSDAMGKTNTYEGTYIGMIDHNVTTITRALDGQAPERGMQGRLAAGS